MKEYLFSIIKDVELPNQKLNLMREYLQAYILKILFDAGFFHDAAFVGGTALRFLYNLPRFSEDLDFSLVEPGKKYSFVKTIEKTKYELEKSGYIVEVKYREESTVNYAFVKFQDILFESGVSALKNQKLSVKLEIDTKPPRGAGVDNIITNKFFPISFTAYDKSSLLSGKIHCLLSRKYTKGRDYFDLGWYLTKWADLEPNYELLKNSLKQTNWQGVMPDKSNWKKLLLEVIDKTDWKTVNKDVKNFLETESDLKILNKENIIKLLS
ncbi:hypothetical protein A2526_04095 [candidate division WOR-1 bacterium RIFOXYD2_FULL_36_8]|nr:MAG: hypothetical protein A2282_08090 [candidate division WOR-1 bacterium RIFOXYA12_FULL_36_13]OGC39749.1 MAG: hypothetical protein A2526_04095 [candidate division WOR-1 bacterium RIFOXYD2_FULL_36_8]